MSKTVTINCDTCNKDLRTTGYESEGYLALLNQWKGHAGGAVFCMSLGPAIKQDMYFCGLDCLRSHELFTDLATPDKEPS